MQTPKLLPNTTPFPNRLLDEVMPQLKDTEWRLLCVIVRQTLGWTDRDGRRKEQDWLTHSQLKARTNRASAAVSAGLNGLIRRNLIEVRDEAGQALPTPAERRRARGRFFYRLHPRMLASWATTSESGFRKAKTTKENETKDSKNPLYFSESEKLASAAEDVSGPPETGAAPEGADGDIPIDPDAAGFVNSYRELYRQHLEREAPETTAEDYRLLAQQAEQYGAEELERLLPAFFASGFGYADRQGYSLASFLNTVEILKMTAGIS